MDVIEATGIDVEAFKKHVRHKKLYYSNQLYIRVSDETYYKILEIQEKIPSFKYSSFLRPIIEDAINRLHKAVMENDPKVLKVVKNE